MSGRIAANADWNRAFFSCLLPPQSHTWRDAWLDVDDRDGYGPENMYFHVVDGGRYEFYVINYSMEQPLMSSEANVVLYKGNTPIRHWEIPSLYQEYSRWNVSTIYGGKVHAPEHA